MFVCYNQTAEVLTSTCFQLFLDNVKAEIRAFELGCHLYPINSIGYGGVHNNFIEALEWLPDNSHEQLLARFEVLHRMQILTLYMSRSRTVSLYLALTLSNVRSHTGCLIVYCIV